jgi:hypothetical protein
VGSAYAPEHPAGSEPFDRRPGEGARPVAEALPVVSASTPEHPAGSEPFDRRPGEGLYPVAEVLPVVIVVEIALPSPGVTDVPTPAEQSAAPPTQAATHRQPAASVERITVGLPTPAEPAGNVQLALPAPPDQAPGRQSPGQPPAVTTAVAQAPFFLSLLVSGAQGPTPAAPLTLSADASPEDVPAGQVLPLAPEGPPPPGGAADRPPQGPLAVPVLAGLVTPATAWVGSSPFRFLRQFFPQAQGAGRSLAASLTQFLRSPWVIGTAAALAALDVLRRARRARRRAPAATELPEITGPRGL